MIKNFLVAGILATSLIVTPFGGVCEEEMNIAYSSMESVTRSDWVITQFYRDCPTAELNMAGLSFSGNYLNVVVNATKGNGNPTGYKIRVKQNNIIGLPQTVSGGESAIYSVDGVSRKILSDVKIDPSRPVIISVEVFGSAGDTAHISFVGSSYN